MSTTHSVLVPIDGSDLSLHVLSLASKLAGDPARISLLQVVPDFVEYYPLEVEMKFGWSAQAAGAMAIEARNDLQLVANSLAGKGESEGKPRVLVEIGDPTEKILSVAADGGFDFIAMTTHGYGAVKRTMFGSVADRIVRHSSVPILVVKPDDDQKEGKSTAIQRIVVPLDGSDRAERALPVAKKLAKLLDIPIVLIRAIKLDSLIPRVDGTFLVPQESYDDVNRFAHEYLKAHKGPLEQASITSSYVCEWGTPFEVIDDYVDEHDLLIMTSHGRGRLSRWLLGSLAEKLVRTSDAPVILVPARVEREVNPAADLKAMSAVVAQATM